MHVDYVHAQRCRDSAAPPSAPRPWTGRQGLGLLRCAAHPLINRPRPLLQVRVHSAKLDRGCPPLALLRHHTKEVTCLQFAPPMAAGTSFLLQGAGMQAPTEVGVRGGSDVPPGWVGRAGEAEEAEEAGEAGLAVGVLSSKHGTLVTGSRDGTVAVWHLLPPSSLRGCRGTKCGED